MPTLDWLNREDAFRIAARVPTCVLRPHARAPAVVGEALAAHGNLPVQGDNLDGLGVAQQLDASITAPRRNQSKPRAGKSGVRCNQFNGE
jgi:hypothetical protein